jgi:hypothetical protein
MSEAGERVTKATQIYWTISFSFHRGLDLTHANLTTSQAIHWSRCAADDLGDHRRVRHKLLALHAKIIVGRGRKKKATPTNNILKFQQVK